MRGPGIASLALLLAITAVVQAVPAAAAAQVSDVRLGLTPGRTRLVVDLSAAFSYEMTSSAGAATLSAKFPGAGTTLPIQLPVHPDALVSGMTLRQEGPDLLLRLELAEPFSEAFAFSLGPSMGKGDRLVIDLYAVDAPGGERPGERVGPDTAPLAEAVSAPIAEA